MAHINKVVSCRFILAMIERTFHPSSSSWQREAIEDIGIAIEEIGYHAGFENKQSEPPYITVKNNRALIPCSVERVKHVEQLLPNTDLTNILNPDGTTPFPQPGYTPHSCSKYKGQRMKLGTDSSGYGLSSTNPRTTQVGPALPYYNLDGNYIYTEFENGLIKLHYVSFITDKEGLPMIISDSSYKLALQWYCFSNMILKGHKHPEVSYKEAFAMWEMYKYRAENAVKALSIDAAERFRAGWNRFINNIDQADNFYINMEYPEYIIKQ